MLDTLSVLEQCRVRLLSLDEQVDRLRRNSVLGRAVSDVVLIVPPPSPASLAMPGDTQKRAEPRCHECHGPVAPYHTGYPHGIDNCGLEHYDLCTGGILEGKDKGGHFWRGCPDSFSPHPDREQIIEKENNEECEEFSSLNQSKSSSDSSANDPSYKPATNYVAPTEEGMGTRLGGGATGAGAAGATGADGGGATGLLGDQPAHSDSNSGFTPTPHYTPSQPGSGQDLLLEAEMAEIARIERETKLLSIKMRKQQAQEDYDRMRRQALGEGAKQKTSSINLPEAVDNIRAQNREVERTEKINTGYTGPTIDHIRRDPYTRDVVTDMMSDVYSAPVFSQVRPASTLGKPKLKASAPKVSYLSKPSIPSSPTPEPLFKWVTQVDRFGVEFKSLVEVTPPPRRPVQPKPKFVVPADPGWFYDEETGRMYRKGAGPVYPADDGDHYAVRRRSYSTPVRPGRQTTVSPRRTHVRRGESTDSRHRTENCDRHGHMEEREGKTMSVVYHARTLPVESAKSVTSKNLSFAAFMYGAVTELHSSLTGFSTPMDQETLEAKLQHIKNVIHVTCLNSSPTDFKPVAWLVGRTYHNLVQAKVDQGRESWAEFNTLYRGSPHASEMVAAEREHRAALSKPALRQVQVGKGDKVADKVGDRSKKPLCSTWNECDTEGKCRWETDNPGLTCNRSHHCSYCEKKGNTKTYHQERFCQRKLGDAK